jgi:hypothetical protein
MPVTLNGSSQYHHLGITDIYRTFPWTIAVRFKPASLAVWHGLYSTGNGGAAGSWSMEVSNVGKVTLGIGTATTLNGPTLPAANEWYTIIGIFKAAAQQYYYLYRESTRTLTFASETFSTTAPIAPTSQNTMIGAWGDAGSGVTDFTNGQISWIGIFKNDKSNGGAARPPAVLDLALNGFWNQLYDGNCAMAVSFASANPRELVLGRTLTAIATPTYPNVPQLTEFRPADPFIWVPVAGVGAATITGTGSPATDVLGAGQTTGAGVTLSGSGPKDNSLGALGAGILSFAVTIQGSGYVTPTPDAAGAGTLSIVLQGAGFREHHPIGAGTLAPSLSINGAGLTDNGTSGAGIVSPVATIQGSGTAATDQGGAGTLSPLATVPGSGFHAHLAFSAGTLAPTATLAGSGLNVPDANGAGSVAPTGVTIQGAGFVSQDTSGAALITGGVVGSVPGSGYTSPDQQGAGTVTAAGVSIPGSGLIGTDNRAGAGSISLGTVTIQGAGYTSPDQSGSAVVIGGTIASVPGSGFSSQPDRLGAGTVSGAGVTIAGSGFTADGSQVAAGAGSVNPVITFQGAGLRTTDASGAAVITAFTPATTIPGSGLDASDKPGAGSVSLGAITIQGAGYNGTSQDPIGGAIITAFTPSVTIQGCGFVATNPSGAAILSLPVYTVQGKGYTGPDSFGAGQAVSISQYTTPPATPYTKILAGVGSSGTSFTVRNSSTKVVLGSTAYTKVKINGG